MCFYPELEDMFYSSAFLAEVKSYRDAQYPQAHPHALQHLRYPRRGLAPTSTP